MPAIALLMLLCSSAGWAAQPPVLLVVGDSLSAEYGLAHNTGWVSLLANRLTQTSMNYRVVNASISGETTIGGRTRLAALLAQNRPKIVILELGANDALRGLSLKATQENLQAMVRAAKAAQATVLLVGMELPPNYGKVYGDRFKKVFTSLAEQEGIALVPFLLVGFEKNRDFFQADQIHPSVRAQPYILENVWSGLQPLLRTSEP